MAYPNSGLQRLMRMLLVAAESHATATTNVATSYAQLRRQFPFLPVLRFTHAGSSWQHRMLDEGDLRNYSPGEWISGGKVVFVHRDPREVLAATYEELRTSLYLRHITPSDVIDNGIVGARKLSRFVRRWRDWCTDNPNCLVISCTDLERNPASQLQTISDFCGFGFSSTTIALACEASVVESGRATPPPDGTPANWNGQSAGSDVWAPRTAEEAVASARDLFSNDELHRIKDIVADEVGTQPSFA